MSDRLSDSPSVVEPHEGILSSDHGILDLAQSELKPLPLRIVEMAAPENDLVAFRRLAVNAHTKSNKRGVLTK